MSDFVEAIGTMKELRQLAFPFRPQLWSRREAVLIHEARLRRQAQPRHLRY